MRYDPSLPDEGVNVSGRHPLREAALLLGALLLGGALLVLGAGAALDWLVPRLPASLETRLFSLPWTAAFGVEADEDDPRGRGAQELTLRLARHGPESPYDFRVAVWEEEALNAVALPGGWILVTEGLLEAVESENELAFVLGHELGHYRGRDHLRGLGRGATLGLLTAALRVGGAGPAAELAGLAGQLASRRFDREQERAADRIGLALVAAEYGHVAGADGFLGRLAESEAEGSGGRLAGYVATHPLSDERVARLRALADAEGWSTRGELRSLPPDLAPATR